MSFVWAIGGMDGLSITRRLTLTSDSFLNCLFTSWISSFNFTFLRGIAERLPPFFANLLVATCLCDCGFILFLKPLNSGPSGFRSL